MKKPVDIIKYQEPEIIIPPVEYLEKLHKINPKFVDDFFEGSRSKQEYLQNLELKRLENEHQQKMAPYEHKNLALKYDFKNRTIGLLLGFTGLIFALCFVGFFVYI